MISKTIHGTCPHGVYSLSGDRDANHVNKCKMETDTLLIVLCCTHIKNMGKKEHGITW